MTYGGQTYFPRDFGRPMLPLAAMFQDGVNPVQIPVAIIDIRDDEYVAVTETGRTVQGIFYNFTITDSRIRHVIYDALQGS